MGSERRVHLRRKTLIAVGIKSITTPAAKMRPLAPGARFMGYDVSAGGLGLESPVRVELGDVFELEIHLPGQARPIPAAAIVRNLKDDVHGKQPIQRVGLEFVRISPADRQTVSNYAKESGFLI